MKEWISENEAIARIAIRVQLDAPLDLLRDAIRSGSISEKESEFEKELGTKCFSENAFAGGFTSIDLNYDERLRDLLAPRISLDDLNAWLDNLLGESKKGKVPASRPPKLKKAIALYRQLYPEGHKTLAITGKAAQNAVIQEYKKIHADTVSPRLVQQAISVAGRSRQ